MEGTIQSVQVLFLCKLCGQSIRNLTKFLEHKRLKHLLEFKKVRCIVFEEKIIENHFTPIDEFPSNSRSTTYPDFLHSDANNDDVDPLEITSATTATCVVAETDQNVQVKSEFVEIPTSTITYDFESSAETADFSNYVENSSQNQQFSTPCIEKYFEVKVDLDSEATTVPKKENPTSFYENNYEDFWTPLVNVAQPETELVIYESNNQVQVQDTIDTKEPIVNPIYNPFVLVKRLRVEDIQIASPKNVNYFKAVLNSTTRQAQRRASNLLRPFKFSCGMCGKKWKNKREFANHLESHKSRQDRIRPFTCQICHTSFRQRQHLRDHFRTHSTVKAFKCSKPGCTKTFKFRASLGRHMAKCPGGDVTIVEAVPDQFPDQVVVEDPVEDPVQVPVMVNCVYPNYVETIQSQFLLYTPEVPMLPVYTGFSMNAPVQSQSSEEAFPFKCTHLNCDKVFRLKSLLRSHQKTHEGIRPYPCQFPNCEKRFRSNAHMVEHFRTHTGERPFSCTVMNCEKSFSTASQLRRHIKTNHKLVNYY